MLHFTIQPRLPPPKIAFVNTFVNTFIWKLQTIHIFLQQTEKNRK